MPSWRTTASSITKAICSDVPCRRRISRDSPELSRRVAVRGGNAGPSIGRTHKAPLEERHYHGIGIAWHSCVYRKLKSDHSDGEVVCRGKAQFLRGSNPSRQGSLQPVAIGSGGKATSRLKYRASIRM